MRRMYSKEQLQKLIDEVSRLIAIEELDKVVPVPSLATAGYIMQVNSAGTGYQLKNIDELQTPLYYHPIYILEYQDNSFMLSCVIINQSPTAFTWESFCNLVESGDFRLAPVSGTIVCGDSTILDLHSLAFGENVVYAYGRNVSTNAVVNAKVITTDWTTIKSKTVVLNDDVNKLN